MQFLLPDLGEGIQEAQILKLLVAEGDRVELDQPLMEVETDKAAVEIPSPVAGTIAKLHGGEGDVVNVGNPLVTFDTGDGAGGGEAAPAAKPAATKKAASKKPATPAAPATPPPPLPSGDVRAAPVIRKLAHRLGVDLRLVRGTGKRGRIVRDDVRAAAENGTAAIGSAPAASGPAPVAPPPVTRVAPIPPTVTPPGEPGKDAHGTTHTERLGQVRKTIAAQMAKSVSTIPHCTNFEDADVTDIDALRRGYNAVNPPERKLTLMAFAIQAIAHSLRRFPVFNATFDGDAMQIVYKDYLNIGIAVDSERGLVVPVMRNVETLDIHGIAASLKQLAHKVRNVSFTVDELRGGSFTVSNAGAAGGANRYATPIINHPESAILALGRARTEPRYVDGELRPRMILPLSLTFDHRATDGAESSRFLGDVIAQLENPARLLLG